MGDVNNSSSIEHDCASLNFETIITIRGISNDTSYVRPLPYAHMDSEFASIYFNGKTLKISLGGVTSGLKNITVILEYTKTTD